MAKTCPEAGKSNVQSVFVCLEDVSGVLQKPTPADYIAPRGNASMNQTPSTTPSEELSESLNALELFQNALEPGEASIPMYLRLQKEGGRPQGHALFLAGMGGAQEPDRVTAAVALQGATGTEVSAAGTTIPLGNVQGGFFPPHGVVMIGEESVLYSGVETNAAGVVTALVGCRRGYGGTAAAAHAEGEEIILKSRVYFQDVCRHTVSLWMKNDHLVQFASGGVVTSIEMGLRNEGGQTVDVTVQFRRMGWASRSFVSGAPQGQVIKVVTKNGDSASQGYTAGGYIYNHTRNDDNAGAGFRITAVDDLNGTLTLEGDIAAWADGDRLDAWLPAASPLGAACESRDARVVIEGKNSTIREGSLSIGTPTEFLAEIGDEFPGESVDTQREISIALNGYMRAESARELGRGYKGSEAAVGLRFGRGAGERLYVHAPRVKVTMPTIGVDGAAFTLDREGAVLGTRGEDALYLIQE